MPNARYSYHNPTPDQMAALTRLRRAFSEVDALVEAVAPACRARDAAQARLEEAATWALKAVVLGAKSNLRPG